METAVRILTAKKLEGTSKKTGKAYSFTTGYCYTDMLGVQEYTSNVDLIADIDHDQEYPVKLENGKVKIG